MPNWAEGNIRFRGKPEDIMNLLKGELLSVGTNKDFEIDEFTPVFEWNEFNDITVSEPEEAKKEVRFYKSLYIKGTHRNFIDSIAGLYLPRYEEEYTLCIDSFRAAWGVDPKPYIEKSKKYHVDIKIVVYECGMCFVQRIEIENGELYLDQEVKYNGEEWNWEADFPNMGG